VAELSAGSNGDATLIGEAAFHRNPTPDENLPQEGNDPVREDRAAFRALPSGAAEHESRYRNILRADDTKKRVHAWKVALQRRNETVVRCFSDGVHGGREKALAAAVAYLDQLLSCHSDFEHQVWMRTRLRKSNTSGIPGVGRDEYGDARNGHHNVSWRAFWRDEQGLLRHGRRYYVSRYGETQAKRLAIAERERQLLRVCEIKTKRAKNQRKPPRNYRKSIK
jgi:hypothetical protein